MKKNFGWILGTVEMVIGFVCFATAQTEISSSGYVWSQPYTSHEAQVLLTKYAGIVLFLFGISWIGLKLFQTSYINKHVQDIDQVNSKGNTKKCLKCGVTVTADMERCPRCGENIK